MGYHATVDNVLRSGGADIGLVSMNNWNDNFNKAKEAKQVLISSPIEGESQFDALLRASPDDGIIYLRRAEAREAIGSTVKASEDYQKALVLLPMPNWKDTASKGLERCRSANLPEQPSEVPATNVLDEYKLPNDIKEIWRKSLSTAGTDPQQCIQAGRIALEATLGKLNPKPVSADRLDEQIKAVSNLGTLRPATITHMHTIRKLGNHAHHAGGEKLTEADKTACLGAIKAVLDDIAGKFD